MNRRGTTNTNSRGNTRDRLARKLFLLTKFGDGVRCACWECGTLVALATIVVDRIIPGAEGGTYRRNNIRPHCSICSQRQGGILGTVRKRAKRLAA